MKHPFVKVSFATIVKDVKETIDKIIAEPEPFTPSSTLSTLLPQQTLPLKECMPLI